MLALTDPLWTKLDDAHRDRDIAALLGMLAKAWDDDAANSLFYDCLCHQGTCYGATYAAVPHLIEIAKPAERRHERLEIAAFLGTVALSGLRPEADDQEDSESVLPNGLPDTLEGWDKKLDVYRGFSRVLARIMHHAGSFCAARRRSHGGDPSVWIGVRPFLMQRV